YGREPAMGIRTSAPSRTPTTTHDQLPKPDARPTRNDSASGHGIARRRKLERYEISAGASVTLVVSRKAAPAMPIPAIRTSTIIPPTPCRGWPSCPSPIRTKNAEITNHGTSWLAGGRYRRFTRSPHSAAGPSRPGRTTLPAESIAIEEHRIVAGHEAADELHYIGDGPDLGFLRRRLWRPAPSRSLPRAQQRRLCQA